MDLPNFQGDVSKYTQDKLTSGAQGDLNRNFGYDSARSEYEFQSGGSVYRVVNNNDGTRSVRQVGNVADRQAQDLAYKQQEAIKPAVASLESSIPEIAQRFASQRTSLEAERTPTQQRYDNILNELKRKEGIEVGQTQQNLKTEYSRRGIPLSSTDYNYALEKGTNPISQFYSGQQANVGFEREGAMRDLNNLISQLTGQETEQQRAVKQAIANLQAGAGKDSVTMALQLLQGNQQQQQFQSQLALQQKIADSEAEYRKILGNSQNALALDSDFESVWRKLGGQ